MTKLVPGIPAHISASWVRGIPPIYPPAGPWESCPYIRQLQPENPAHVSASWILEIPPIYPPAESWESRPYTSQLDPGNPPIYPPAGSWQSRPYIHFNHPRNTDSPSDNEIVGRVQGSDDEDRKRSRRAHCFGRSLKPLAGVLAGSLLGCLRVCLLVDLLVSLLVACSCVPASLLDSLLSG